MIGVETPLYHEDEDDEQLGMSEHLVLFGPMPGSFPR